MCTDCISSLSERTETDRYSPSVIAINDALEKLEDLNIRGLKRVPEVAGPSIFLVNHPNEPVWQGCVTQEARHCDHAIERCGPSMLVSAAHEVAGLVGETRAGWR